MFMNKEIQVILKTESVNKLIKQVFLKKNYNDLFIKVNEFKQSYYSNIILSFSELMYLYSFDLTSKPKCECGEICKFKSFSEGYRKYCSTKCSANSKEKKEKIKSTCLKKYGVKNVSNCNKIKDRKKTTFNKNYKKDHVWSKKDGEVRSCETTCIKKHGVDNVFKLKKVQEGIIKNREEKHGVKYPFQNEDVRKKSKKTLFKNHKVTNACYLKKRVRTSKKERELIKHLNGKKFKFNKRNYDFCINNDVFEIDGDYFHPLKIENLSLIQINNVLNDFRKRNDLKETQFKLYRILISSLPKDMNLITIDLLKQLSYEPDYLINYETIIISKEYISSYIKKKGIDNFSKYINSSLTGICKEIGNLNISEEEIKIKIKKLVKLHKDINLKNIVEI